MIDSGATTLRDAFISHSSADHALARRLERALGANGLEVWLDDSDIRSGVMLGDELQGAILGCRVLVLLWSEDAAKSRWVNSEWLLALHQGRFIVPCALDETPLPQCIRNDVFLKLPNVRKEVVSRLVRDIQGAGNKRTPLAPLIRHESRELRRTIVEIDRMQQQVIARLSSDPDEAARVQAQLGPVMASARRKWKLDPMIVNLDGYHLKNAYMVKYWEAIQAGRAPKRRLLDRSERRFFETLAIDPTDPSALNGLGNVLFFNRDLNAAEFFHRAAIAAAGGSYAAGEHDLELVLSYKRDMAALAGANGE
jgi:hypothetical protein